jgi:hypothetical protein
MAEGVADETDERSGGDGPDDRREPSSSGGDLEFDEAWNEPHGADESRERERSAKDEVPTFEDPNDR